MSVVYVDFLFKAVAREPQARRVGELNGHRWCHMWSDDVEALHKVAKAIRLKRKYFQDRPGFPHYDLTPGRRKLALQQGVIERHLIDYKREKLKAGREEREKKFGEYVNSDINPHRKQIGLNPIDDVEAKKVFQMLEQSELELFLFSAT